MCDTNEKVAQKDDFESKRIQKEIQRDNDMRITPPQKDTEFTLSKESASKTDH